MMDPRWTLLAVGSLGQLSSLAAVFAEPDRRRPWIRPSLLAGAGAVLALAFWERDPVLFCGQLAALPLGLSLTRGRSEGAGA